MEHLLVLKTVNNLKKNRKESNQLVKKFLVKLIVFLLFYSSAETKVILSDCNFLTTNYTNNTEHKIEINDAKTILTEIQIRSDAEIVKKPDLDKVYIQKYNINYQNDSMINAVGLSPTKTIEITLTVDLKNKKVNKKLDSTIGRHAYLDTQVFFCRDLFPVNGDLKVKKETTSRSISNANQTQTKFGFSLNVPEGYIHLNEDLNLDQFLKRYKGKEADVNYIRQLTKSVIGNASYEYFIHRNFTANGNSINFNQIQNASSTIAQYKQTEKSELCNFLRSQISNMYNGKNVKQYNCGFIGEINNNISEVFKMTHDGRLPNQKLIQYQFQFKESLITVTLGCFKENCDSMDKDLTNMLESIGY